MAGMTTTTASQKDELATVAVVLDINGVLADVRRHEAPPVLLRRPDAVLANRQKAYVHPAAREFLRWLCAGRVPTIMFTSRSRQNAAAVELRLERDCGADAYAPLLRMYGEDCDGLSCPGESWRPMKSDTAVRRRLTAETGIAPDALLIFVDDHPDRVLIGDPSRACAVHVESYDALRDDDASAADKLARAAGRLREALGQVYPQQQ